jgi:hypothetical protein
MNIYKRVRTKGKKKHGNLLLPVILVENQYFTNFALQQCANRAYKTAQREAQLNDFDRRKKIAQEANNMDEIKRFNMGQLDTLRSDLEKGSCVPNSLWSVVQRFCTVSKRLWIRYFLFHIKK